MINFLWKTAGIISLALAIIGIVTPLLPTTPFLLLTAFCWAKSDKKLYEKLLNSPYLGEYIKNYKEKKKIPLKTKIISLVFLWTALTVSFCFLKTAWALAILSAVAIAVTWHILKI
ncbi:MAG: DUF454 domain-containing protein [Elusimicrobia bacterium]|nr:DUF454 domain-containing protein [Elusimicrobiota bacterium]